MGEDAVERTLERIVALVRVAEAVADPLERRRLSRVVLGLEQEVGVGVAKRRAARLLDVSVQALERWLASGELPTVRRPGSSRSLIETEALVALAVEVARRREAGERRGLVASSLRALAGSGRLPRRLHPNQSAAELRGNLQATTPAGRLRDVVALSETVALLARHGAARREAGHVGA